MKKELIISILFIVLSSIVIILNIYLNNVVIRTLIMSIYAISIFTTGLLYIRFKRIEKKNNDRYTTNIMHTLRTPLTKIGAYTELANIELNDENLTLVQSEVKELDYYISNLINLSITNENYNKSITNISNILNAELEKVSMLRNLDIKIEEVFWDISELNCKILFSTLIDNAVKYSKQNITCSLTKDSLVMTNDTNVKEGNYNHLFTRFSRGTKGNGFGIGLAVIKEIVESINYKLDANVKDGYMTITIKK